MKTKNIFKTIIAAVAFFCINTNTNAQSPSVSEAFVTMDENSNVYTGTFTVIVSDTVDVSQIEIKLGTFSSANDITLQTYDYDVTTGLAPRSYTRAGNKIILGIGDFTERNTWFGEARIKDNSGNWSTPYKFIFN